VNTRASDSVSQLCPACGFCCNGGLFGDVELQRGDDAQRLGSLGLELLRKGRKIVFAQPCACFDRKHCGIYADRPVQCRAFECRVLQRVQAGKQTISAALRVIRLARRQAEAVRKLIHALGHADETIPLNERYAAVLAQPIDFAGEASVVKHRGQLMRAAGQLAETLARDFLA